MTNDATSTAAPVDPFAKHLLDLDASENGVWVTIRDDKFRVCRMPNQRMGALRAQFMAEHGLPPESDITGDLVAEWAPFSFARAVLMDVQVASNPGFAYQPHHGERIWTDPQLHDIKTRLIDVARGDWTKANLTAQAILGNLEPCSNGSTSAAPSETR